MKQFSITIMVMLVCHAAVASVAAGDGAGHVATITERYTTTLEPSANIDSVAVSPARSGQPALLFATAKATNVLKVFDASTGAGIREIGSTGTSPEQYLRPNGVTVVDDLLVVVERDNQRISIRSMPDFRVLATFGAEQLRNPYGLWIHSLQDNQYRLYVTDAYEMPDESVPPNSELGERVKTWLFTVELDDSGRPGSIVYEYERAFGDTGTAGALRVVESLFGDPLHDRLLIAEEDEGERLGRVIKVYNLAGEFTGKVIGKGIFQAQAEGIALYACDDGSGYWVSTDQDTNRSVYHLFDRETLQHVGAFTGESTANTDGIWLAPAGVPGFGDGAFYAVHDDQAVSAFDWADIEKALDLESCN